VKGRCVRDLEGFEAAAAEVIERCGASGYGFRALLKSAGACIMPATITSVTPALLYNICIGISRHRNDVRWEREDAQARSASVIDLGEVREKDRMRARVYAACDSHAAWWLPTSLDGQTGGEWDKDHPRYGYEPTGLEFRMGQFVANDVAPEPAP
jgi:hypothetical protein